MSNIIVPKPGVDPTRMDESAAIDRYWKNKETGVWVEVQKNLRIDGSIRRVVYLNPDTGVSLSAFLADFQKDHEPMGNTSAKF
jgi:hypothetical protein